MSRRNVESPITGSVWTHSVGVGQRVTTGTILVILESMKMEIPVETPCDGEVKWLKACGEMINVGDVVATVDDAPAP